MRYKYPMIDLPRLLRTWTNKEWTALLTKCEREGDVEKLKSTLYGICRGMDELAKCKLNDERMSVAFCHLQRSIEVTVKRILRRKYPSILDTIPKNRQGLSLNLNDVDEARMRRELQNKRKRDLEFAQFLKDARF